MDYWKITLYVIAKKAKTNKAISLKLIRLFVSILSKNSKPIKIGIAEASGAQIKEKRKGTIFWHPKPSQPFMPMLVLTKKREN
jgi:hypothetical protein